jgi:vacuolar-type H+-ATPase subunit H
MEKYHKTDIIGVEQENERDENYQADNPQIDPTRTRENYNIIKRQRSYTQFINDKIAALDLPTKVRKDAVLMCSFVVGSDREFFGNLSEEEQQQFFVDCTRFFAERYGEDNVISAVVHMDETTPHLHLNLIPIADRRLSAKTLFDRKSLQALQTDFHSAVGKKWGLQRGREGSQAKHLSTVEFKAKKIVEQASDEADRRLQNARLHANDVIALANTRADHKLQMTQSHADGIVAEAQSQADNAKAQAQGYLDGVIQSVENEKAKPIPKRRRQAEEEISLLRTENEALRQSKSIADRDRKDLFEQLQKAERAGKGKEQAFKMVTDMLSAYPKEFDALLSKSRAKKSDTSPFKSSGFDRGGK